MTYHPNFFTGEDKGKRQECMKRMAYMSPHVHGSLLDVGCSEGFYSFAFSKKCSPIFAIDREQSLIDTCLKTQEEHGTKIRFAVGDLDQKIDEICEVKWDTILYMSIHHHIVSAYGAKKAAEIIQKLSRAGGTMIFDMGQKDEQNCMSHKWWKMLPQVPDPAGWVKRYLETYTEYGTVVKIGSSTIHGTERVLWKLTT